MNKMLKIGFIAEYININSSGMEDYERGFFNLREVQDITQ